MLITWLGEDQCRMCLRAEGREQVAAVVAASRFTMLRGMYDQPGDPTPGQGGAAAFHAARAAARKAWGGR